MKYSAFVCASRNVAVTATRVAFAGLMLGFLTGCHSDDPAPLPDLEASETFTGTELALTYNGETMPGKSVRVATDGDNATLTLYSEFDLSQITGAGLTGTVAGPGVIPGSPSLDLPVTLSPGDGCYTFSGHTSTPDVEFSYAGGLTDKTLTLAITDARLLDTRYSGMVMTPAPLVKSGLFDYESMPLHLVWEIDPALGVDLPLSDILKAVAVAPVIPVYSGTAYTSVAQMIESAVKTFSFNPSGNLPVMYVSTVGGAAHVTTTCGNMLQYVPSASGMRLYVNPLSALSQVLVALSKPSDDAHFAMPRAGAADASGSASDAGGSSLDGVDPALLSAMIQALAKAVAPSLSQGLPLTVTPTQIGADVYFDTATSVAFLSSIAQYMLADPQIAAALKSYIAGLGLPDVDPTKIDAIMAQLPQYLIHTTRLEIGLSLKTAAN